ncbi:UDP-N-acetylglucosamine--LPS N-acetylglucosamine transferase (plasmid) [Alloyangia pacifica]|uniref:UDP-N-acetylglucosamine--LPS N-acetylglucosamine transferase n=1 Tax=Alloyangia pacifica TaxID=311180 RepID=A0A2U8HM21_9RHOB|nr:UDP-N-acetylglucosamine--LPS N-acetylglucosamine transferase [Alloyangia pacifica]AWI86803.1 UDP-N-acetylglucosamine--LPS N-acetylglucosamine transferase [Alloyangia pacifica]
MVQRVLAVASAGGHWQQLCLLREAFAEHEVLYMTTMGGLPEHFNATPAVIVPDCNRDRPALAVLAALRVFWCLLTWRPQVILSTGAMSGLLAIAGGRLFGARTIWIDSVANAESMSKSGTLARRWAHLSLSQWEHVARDTGVDYAGSIL